MPLQVRNSVRIWALSFGVKSLQRLLYESKNMSTVIPFTRSIWARRRSDAKALASATKKRDLPTIELTDEELALLRRADALAREMRIAEEKAR